MSSTCPPAGHAFVEHGKSHYIFCKNCGDIRSIGMEGGMIVMWSGELKDIPNGWVLCDGTNGTPDLRDKFVVGAGGGYQPRSKGGSIHTKLNTQNIPSHTHYRHPDSFYELPVVCEEIPVGSKSSLVLMTKTVAVPKEPYCKKAGCKQWPTCCDASGWNRANYQREGHEKVIPEPQSWYTIPSYQTRTREGGTKDPDPIDVRPPYYALIFIMRKDN